MFWTVLALILLVVLGGFIAYYGDLQGRRWGKKRVSLFGLRPKYTAILLTSLTGVFISLFSILTLLAVSPTVRDVVLRGEYAIQENKRLNAALEGERISNEKRLKTQAEEIAANRAMLQVLQNDLTKNRQELERNRTELARVEAFNNQLKDRNMLLQNDLYVKQRRATLLTANNRKLVASNRNLVTSNANLVQENRRLVLDNERADEINQVLGRENVILTREKSLLESSVQRLQDRTRELTETNTRLTQVNRDLKREETELKRVKDVLQRANQAQLDANSVIEDKRRALAREVAEKEALLEQQNQQLKRIEEQFQDARNFFERSYLALRQGRLNLRAGAELARLEIAPGSNSSAVRQQLEELLLNASQTAMRFGAGRGKNDRAVRIVDKSLVSDTGEVHAVADEAATLNAQMMQLADQSQSQVVTVYTVANCIDGEQALVDLSSQPIRPLFRRNQEVAVRVIDARQEVPNIVRDIVAFLRTDVREAALKAGILPQIDPETGTPQVGETDIGDLVLLTERVRRQGGQVRLQAVAAVDLSSADPLRLDFRLARSESKP